MHPVQPATTNAPPINGSARKLTALRTRNARTSTFAAITRIWLLLWIQPRSLVSPIHPSRPRTLTHRRVLVFLRRHSRKSRTSSRSKLDLSMMCGIFSVTTLRPRWFWRPSYKMAFNPPMRPCKPTFSCRPACRLPPSIFWAWCAMRSWLGRSSPAPRSRSSYRSSPLGTPHFTCRCSSTTSQGSKQQSGPRHRGRSRNADRQCI